MLAEIDVTDGDLLIKYLEEKDPETLELLVRRHAGMVVQACRRTLGDSPDADDAFQATFIVLLKSRQPLRKPQSLGAWLYGVAIRICRRIRSKRRTLNLRSPCHPPGMDEAVDDADEPLKMMSRRHDLEVLDLELAQLPERQRAPLVLHYLEHKPIRQIALELGTTEAAVDGLLKRGRSQLRHRLMRRGIEFSAIMAAVASSSVEASCEVSIVNSLPRIAAGSEFGDAIPAGPSHPVSVQYAQQEIHMIGSLAFWKSSTYVAVAAGSLAVFPFLAPSLEPRGQGANSHVIGSIWQQSVWPQVALAEVTVEPAKLAETQQREGDVDLVVTTAAAGRRDDGQQPESLEFDSWTKAERDLLEKLQTREVDVSIPAGTMLDELAKTLSKAAGVVIRIHPELLIREQFIGTDIQHSGSLGSLLESLSDVGDDEALVYVVRHGEIQLMSRAMERQRGETRVYSVAGLNMDPQILQAVTEEPVELALRSSSPAGRWVVQLPQSDHRRLSGVIKQLRAERLVAAKRWETSEGAAEFYGSSSTRNAVEKALARAMPVDLNDAPLLDAADFLRTATGISIWFNSRKMEEEGVASDAPVTLVGTMPLTRVFERMLAPLELTTIVHDDGIEITTVGDAETRFEMRTYDVEDLDPIGEQLADVIRSMVPGDWDVPSTDTPAIAVATIRGSLIINQTQAGHRKIAELLRQQRSLAKNRATQGRAVDTTPPPTPTGGGADGMSGFGGNGGGVGGGGFGGGGGAAQGGGMF